MKYIDDQSHLATFVGTITILIVVSEHKFSSCGVPIVMIFVTTPQHATHHMDDFVQGLLGSSLSQSLLEYLSSALLLLFTFMMPMLVGLLDSWQGHITKSAVYIIQTLTIL